MGRKNRNLYAKLLLHMLKRGVLEGPFTHKPEPGTLKTLPSYMVGVTSVFKNLLKYILKTLLSLCFGMSVNTGIFLAYLVIWVGKNLSLCKETCFFFKIQILRRLIKIGLLKEYEVLCS